MIKWEYYRLERWSNFSNLACTGKGLAGPLDLDLSTEFMQNWPQKKYREKKQNTVQNSLTYKKQVEKKSVLSKQQNK